MQEVLKCQHWILFWLQRGWFEWGSHYSVHPLTLDQSQIRILTQWLLHRSLQNSDFMLVQALAPDLVQITYHCILIIGSPVTHKMNFTDYCDYKEICCIAAVLTCYPLKYAGLHSLKRSSNSGKYCLGYFRSMPVISYLKSWIVINCSDCMGQQQEL